MASAWGIVVPLALGAAVSPTLLTIQLLILAGGRQPKARAWAFTVGVAVDTAVYMLVIATVARGLALNSDTQGPGSRAVKLVAAALLLWLGIRALVHRNADKEPGRAEKMLEAARPRAFVGLGVFAMATNFSSLVLILPAVHAAINSGSTRGQVGAMLALIFVLTLAPVLVPVLAATIAGRRADPVLARLNRFTTAHSAEINAGIAFLFAALLIYSAVKG